MKVSIITLLTVVAVAVGSLGLIAEVPSPTPYSPFNTGGRGYSGLRDLLGASVLIEGAQGASTIILPLAHDLSPADASTLRDFVLGGGTLIILDEGGHSSKFLNDYLNLSIAVGDSPIYDYVANYRGNGSVVTVNVSVSGEEYLCYFGSPTFIVIGGGAEVLGRTSPYAYADLDGNGYFSLGDSFGDWAVAISAKVGEGRVYVLGDLDIFSNAMIGVGDNAALAKTLVNGHPAIYLGGINASLLDEMKAVVGSAGGMLNYVAEASSLAMIATVIVLGRRWGLID